MNNQSEPPHSPGLVSVLESRQLENLQRLPLTGQVKITPHIRVHRSSTPAGSQNPTPSASFRQISVIQSVDSVFEEDSSLAQEVAENSLQPIAHSLPSSQISIMEEKENDIQNLKDIMDNTRECLPVEGINHVNVDRLANVPEDLREKLMERRLKVVKLKHDHKEEKTNEQWNVFVEENKIYHEEMIDYITVLGDKLLRLS